MNRHGCKAPNEPLGGKFGEADGELDRSTPPVHDDDRLVDGLSHLQLKRLLTPSSRGLPARLTFSPDADPSVVGGETEAADDLSPELLPRVFAADPVEVGDIDP